MRRRPDRRMQRRCRSRQRPDRTGPRKRGVRVAPRLASFEPGYQAPDTLVNALSILLEGDYPRGMPLSPPPPEFRLRGEAGIGDGDLAGSVSCVLPALRLNDLISPPDLARFHREGLVFPSSSDEPWFEKTIDRWRQKPARERRVRFDPSGTLGRPRSVVWFTRRRSLASAPGHRDAGNHAQRSRDRLGLVHHGRGAVLAALHFPAQLLRTRSSARPTFMDAADHLRFRAWPDGRRARSDRTWGRTVDLRALDRGERSVDGCPERVTRDIPGSALPEGGRFEFDLLGAVDEALGEGPDDDGIYAARLRGGMSAADLGSRLRSFL